jgi:uncharacterized protein (DUF433 family)
MVAVALKTVAAKLGNRHFTTSEVAAMLGMALAEVNNLIDEVVHLGVAVAGKGRRSVSSQGMFVMLVARELIHCEINPEMRARTLAEAVRGKRKRVPIPGTNLEVLVEAYRKEVNQGLRLLYEAEAAIERKPGVMQGEPCLRGTRVPVYTVGAIAAARGIKEASATYPHLSLRQVELAKVYTRAHPRKGPPKKTIFPTVGKVVFRKVIKRRRRPEARA